MIELGGAYRYRWWWGGGGGEGGAGTGVWEDEGGGGRREKGSKLTYVLFRVFGARERAAETVGG